MDVREKLVELLNMCVDENIELDDGFVGYGVNYANMADYLIAHGVTVQEWISVKDRLPEAGTKALCYLKRGEYWTAVWDDCGDDLWSDGEAWCSNGEVTHWMPLPQPPKGE